ncbi:hypothetical protein AUP68_03135 [Ilyonectria robusta]
MSRPRTTVAQCTQHGDSVPFPSIRRRATAAQRIQTGITAPHTVLAVHPSTETCPRSPDHPPIDSRDLLGKEHVRPEARTPRLFSALCRQTPIPHDTTPGSVLKHFLPGRDRAENMSWELPVLTSLILSVLGFWWVYNPHSSYQKALVYAVVCGLTVLLDPRRLLLHMSASPIGLDTLLDLRPHVLLIHNFKMVLTLGAVVW